MSAHRVHLWKILQWNIHHCVHWCCCICSYFAVDDADIVATDAVDDATNAVVDEDDTYLIAKTCKFKIMPSKKG